MSEKLGDGVKKRYDEKAKQPSITNLSKRREESKSVGRVTASPTKATAEDHTALLRNLKDAPDKILRKGEGNANC